MNKDNPYKLRSSWTLLLLLALVAMSSLPTFGQRSASAEAVVINGFLVAVNVKDTGEGYMDVPTVTVEGNGSGAVAKATLNDGKVVSIQVLDAGRNYSTSPTIVIGPPPETNRFLTERFAAYFPLDSTPQNILQLTPVPFTQGVTQRKDGGHPLGRWTEFSGSNSFVISEKSAFISAISNWTWSAWIKLPKTPVNRGRYQFFYSEGNQSSTFWVGYYPVTGEILVSAWNRDTPPDEWPEAPRWRQVPFAFRPTTNWFQLSLTMENATSQGGALRMFTNGVFYRSANLQLSLPPSGQQVPSQIQVGLGEDIVYFYKQISAATFEGGMSDVRIFQRTLSSSEVARLYTGDRRDSDGDGINDNIEVQRYGTIPTLSDSDSDGEDDGDEIVSGANPLDPRSRPETIQAFTAVELEFWTNLNAFYQLQSSPDLAAWSDIGSVFPGIGDKLTRLASTRPHQHLYWRLVRR
jgi:hypothetical protein